MSQKIELAKSRDFGEIINDTFNFVKLNFKPLLSAFFVFCGFFLASFILLQCLQQIKVMDIQQRMMTDPESMNSFNNATPFGLEVLLMFVFMTLNYTVMVTTILCFISLYKEKGNIAPTNAELWGYIKYYYLRVIGASIVLAILLTLGFVFCLIPGIWLYPIFGLIFPIMIFENGSFNYAFSRSFNLIKENWWATFGVLFVVSLIVSTSYMIFNLPLLVVTIFNMLTHSGNGKISPYITIAATAFQGLGQVLLILPIITLALCYFNLAEKKDGTGLIERINQFGTHTDNNLPAEEY